MPATAGAGISFFQQTDICLQFFDISVISSLNLCSQHLVIHQFQYATHVICVYYRHLCYLPAYLSSFLSRNKPCLVAEILDMVSTTFVQAFLHAAVVSQVVLVHLPFTDPSAQSADRSRKFIAKSTYTYTGVHPTPTPTYLHTCTTKHRI